MSVKERLVGLLTYTEKLAELTQKANFSTKGYRTLLYSEQQLHGRMGIEHNVDESDNLAWLKIKRLHREEPPTPSDEITEWIELHRDPTKKPTIHDSILRPMQREEARVLVESEKVEPKDVMESSRDDSESVDVRLLLRNHPEIKTQVDAYFAGPWASWRAEEIPKMETIAIYEKFFNLAQTIENSGADNPLEVVWGLGFMLWKQNSKTLQHPLIEALVEVRIDLQSHAVLVTPRDRQPQFYTSPLTELGVETVRSSSERMRERFDSILRPTEKTGKPIAEEFSPFDRTSFEPVLEVAAGSLTGDGRYWPQVNRDPENREHPKPTETLTITDTWAIYARPRGNNIFVEDIKKLRDQVKKTDDRELPRVGTSIVRDPNEDQVTAGTGVSGAPNSTETTSGLPADEEEDVLFPKPSNDAQLKIVKGLQRQDGVVVQGPPGTGKTHTIANIICHYLATGRSVLVVSKGEPALAVLRDQIPEGIRDLTISLLTNEHNGMKQLEGSVMFMMNDVLGKDDDDLKRTIRDNHERTEQLKRDLSAIDARMRQLAEAQLTRIPDSMKLGDKDWPFEAAKQLATNQQQYEWLNDSLGTDEKFNPQFDNDDIATARDARRRLGKDLAYASTTIPHRNDLPTSRDIASTHVSLVQAATVLKTSSTGSLPPIIGRDEVTRESGKRLVEDLKTMQSALGHVAEEAWIKHLYSGWIENGLALTDSSSPEAAIAELETLGEERKAFRVRPIAWPPQAVSPTNLKQALQRGAETGKPFGMMSFGAKALKQYLQDTTIAGQPPESAEDWSYLLEYIAFRERIVTFSFRWNALAEDFELPEISSDADELERWISKKQKSLSTVLRSAVRYHDSVASDVQNLFVSGVDRKTLPFDPNKMAEMTNTIGGYLHGQDLSESRFLLEKVQRDLHGKQGPIFDACRAVVDGEVGDSKHDPQLIEQRWSAILAEFDRLNGLQSDFATIERLAQQVEDSGASRWAERLRTVPVEADTDNETPGDWNDAWRFQRLRAYLKAIDAREELKELSGKRISGRKALERSTQELVKTKTYLGLKKRMGIGGRMAALQQFVSAIRNIGRGTGVRANRFRGDAQKAMQQCMEAVPCWIMPTWRVSESLPSTLGSFDLVIIDEASQSDVMALPALLRGQKVLVVGDDRQVSPSSVGLEERKLVQLQNGYLKDQPFASLLMPGISFYELAQAVFPTGRTMLNEHFRCVEPIIRFSLQFYPEKFTPLRIPKPSERLDPPLVDVLIKNATRSGKVNEAEVAAIVDEIERLVDDPAYEKRTIGVVCLVGNQQASVIQKRLLERIGEDTFLKHKITCGDPPTFQGKERDIIFLSMIAVPGNATAQTTRQVEQRFNVALSRARDRMYLYRSVEETDLRNEGDLKAKVIAHFKSPMPEAVEHMKELIDLCDSDFEKDVYRRLAAMNYRVTPQVAVGGYNIDLVVDGGNDRRLAIELDGDQYHGPDRWFEDYARQKTLERMNWQFWRCWGSSFAIDPDSCMADLVDTLNERGIEPIGQSTGRSRFTDHRVLDAAEILGGTAPSQPDVVESESSATDGSTVESTEIGVGTSVTVLFSNENKRPYRLQLVDGESDLLNGDISITSRIGMQLLEVREEDEIQLDWGGCLRTCTVQSIQFPESADV